MPNIVVSNNIPMGSSTETINKILNFIGINNSFSSRNSVTITMPRFGSLYKHLNAGFLFSKSDKAWTNTDTTTGGTNILVSSDGSESEYSATTSKTSQAYIFKDHSIDLSSLSDFSNITDFTNKNILILLYYPGANGNYSSNSHILYYDGSKNKSLSLITNNKIMLSPHIGFNCYDSFGGWHNEGYHTYYMDLTTLLHPNHLDTSLSISGTYRDSASAEFGSLGSFIDSSRSINTYTAYAMYGDTIAFNYSQQRNSDPTISTKIQAVAYAGFNTSALFINDTTINLRTFCYANRLKLGDTDNKSDSVASPTWSNLIENEYADILNTVTTNDATTTSAESKRQIKVSFAILD